MKANTLLTLILLLPINGWATDVRWTLSRFLNETVNQSYEVQQQQLVVERTELLQDEKKAAFLPSLTGKVEASQVSTASDNTVTRSSLSLTQNIFNGLRDKSNLNVTTNQLAAEKLISEEATRSQIESSLKAYFQLLQAQSDYDSQKKEIEINQKSLADLRNRVNYGGARASEVINLETLIANNELSLSTMKLALEEKKIQARRLLNQTDNNLTLQHKTYTFKENEVRAFASQLNSLKRADYRTKEALVAAQKETVTAIKGLKFPTLDFSANYYLGSTDNSTQEGDYSLGITLTVPMPFSFEKKAQVSQAEKNLMIAEFEQQKTLKNLEQDRDLIIQKLLSNLEQIKLLEKAKSLSSKNVESLTRDQRNGLSSYSDVLQAASSYQQVLRQFNRLNLEFELNCYLAMVWTSSDQLFTFLRGAS